jgi:hypothetical protein
LARVVAPKKSLPPRGSVSPSAEIISARRIGPRYVSFCSSVPKRLRASPTMLGME